MGRAAGLFSPGEAPSALTNDLTPSLRSHSQFPSQLLCCSPTVS
jgi:hypothetical protein